MGYPSQGYDLGDTTLESMTMRGRTNRSLLELQWISELKRGNWKKISAHTVLLLMVYKILHDFYSIVWYI